MRTLHRVLVFPAWVDNPYLNLMSLAPRASGYEFRGATVLDSLLKMSRDLESGDILHLHWTSPILQRAATEDDARNSLREFRTALEELHGRGVRLIWTVHNQLPHELTYRDVEIALYRLLAERADAIHVMAPATKQVLAAVCELPEHRVTVIPHPSYLGVYGVPPSKGEARRALGVDELGPTVLFLGQMRPYKGLGTLLAALRRLAEHGERLPTLLLAGAATPEAREEIEAAIPAELQVIAKYEFVPDEEVGTWFAAADLAVFPYSAILNSGSLHLSAAFHVPALLPNEAHLVEQFENEAWVGFFDLDDPIVSMSEEISRRLAEQAPADLTARFDEFNQSISPWRMSRSYQALLEDVTAASH